MKIKASDKQHSSYPINLSHQPDRLDPINTSSQADFTNPLQMNITPSDKQQNPNPINLPHKPKLLVHIQHFYISQTVLINYR